MIVLAWACALGGVVGVGLLPVTMLSRRGWWRMVVTLAMALILLGAATWGGIYIATAYGATGLGP